MNPFQAIMGAMGGGMGQPAQQMPAQAPQMGNQQAPDWNALMGQLRSDPAGALKTAGYNVPDELIGNPQATVMHLIQSGQVSSPLMQRIQPLLNRMGVR